MIDTESRLQKMLEALPHMVWTADAAGNANYMNSQWDLYTGQPAPSTTEERIKFIHPDDRTLVRQVWQASVETGTPFEVEYRIRNKQGEYRWFLGKAVPLFENGKVVEWFGTLTDIEDQKATEEAAQHRAAVVDSTSDAIITKTLDGIISSWNKAAEHIFGYTAQEVIGQPVTMLFPPDHINEESDIIARIKKGEQVGHYETIRRTKDGKLINVSLTISPIKNRRGEIVGASKIARNIDRQKQYEQQLINQANELEQFAYVASHDLQEPLRKVGTYAQMLSARSKNLDADSSLYLTNVTSGVKRMQALISDLLTFSRVSRTESIRKIVDLNEVAVQVLSDLEVVIYEKRADVAMDQLPHVLANSFQMHQLFQNLIGNAIKFSGPAIPKVHISCQQKDKTYIFSIKDNGIGISPKYNEQIFKVFQRLHGQEKYPGTGIGLAICKRIVEQHEGKIWVESVLGQGSTFYFSLPIRTKADGSDSL